MVNSYRNTISEWAVIFRYENFFIPRVEKSSKISTRAKNLVLPRAVGPREARFFFPRANFWGFLNPWDEEIFIPENHGPFGNYIPVRVNQAILCFIWQVFKKIACLSKKLSNCSSLKRISTWVMWKSDFHMAKKFVK